jgi:CubicO group peptidase (beta-lactamase class C family)
VQWFFFFSVIVALCLMHCPASAMRTDFSELDKYIETQMSRAGIPGAALVVVSNEKIVHLRAFGVRGPGGQPVTSRTMFMIGSNAKSITALAIMQIVESGRIELDAPVVRYLPYFRTADSSSFEKVTIRQLLNQSSGFSNADGQRYFSDEDDSKNALEKQIRKLSAVHLVSAPGERYEYSNINYIILGGLIEAVMGEPFSQYIQSNIFIPLKMVDTAAAGEVRTKADVATGYRYWFSKAVPAHGLPEPKVLAPAGWMFSTAEDMGRYLLAHVNRGEVDSTRILSRAGMDELHRVGIQKGVAGEGYAMGWDTDSAKPDVFSHEGALPSFSSAMAISPDGGWGYALLLNSDYALNQPGAIFISAQIRRFFAGGTPLPVAVKKVWPSSVVSLICFIAFCLTSALLQLRRVLAWRRGDASIPGRRVVWLLNSVLPLAIGSGIAYGLTIVIPQSNGSNISSLFLFAPDVGWILMIGTVAVLFSGIAITGLAWSAYRRKSMSPWKNRKNAIAGLGT